MTKIIGALVGLFLVTSAYAADNQVVVTPGTGLTLKSLDVGAGVQATQPVPSGPTGLPVTFYSAGADTVTNSAYGYAVYNFPLVWNGTTWDRWYGDKTNGAWVNVKTSVLPTGAASSANQSTISTNLGSQADSVCGSATGSCSLIALQKYANSAIVSAVPWLATTAWSTNSYSNGTTNPGAADLHGAPFVDVGAVNGVAILTGSGATGTGSPRVTQAVDQATNAGAALVKGGVGVVNGGSFYQAVAASQTAAVLQSSTGAAGDYLSHCVIYPTSTSPGAVTVFDSTNTAANSAILFPGGASSVSNLVPFAVPVGAISVNGAWKVTTGSAVSVVCYGKFS